jgi:hypothetical protein
VYKCTDAGGSVIYQEIPCVRNQKSSSVAMPSGERPGYSRTEITPGKKNLTSADYMSAARGITARQRDVRVLSSQRVRDTAPGEAEACLAGYRNSFADPRSLQVVESVVLRDSVEEYLALEVAARDRSGAEVTTKVFCSLPPAAPKRG